MRFGEPRSGDVQAGENMDSTSRFELASDDSAADAGFAANGFARLARIGPHSQDAANQAPVIDHLDGDSVVQVEMDFNSTPYIDLGLDAVVSDPDGTDFSGARLTVAVTAGMQPTDELSITFFAPLSFSPADHLIFYNNVEIAHYSGGSQGDATLTIDFEAGTTAEMVQTVLRNIYLRDDATTLTNRTRTVEVTLNDGHGTGNGGSDTSSYTTTVSTLTINHAPQGSDATLTAIEDQVYTFTRGDFPLTDTDGNGLGGVEFDTLPGNGTLLLNGSPVGQFQLVAASLIDAGALTFVPAPNAHGANYASFSVRVQDDGGTANNGRNMDPFAHTITIDVASVNDAPHGANATYSVDEDDVMFFGLSYFGFGDPDGNQLANVIIDTLPGLGTLTLNGVPVTAGQAIAASDIVAAKLVYVPEPNGNGANYASFTFHVQDDGGTSDGGVDTSVTANTFTIDVNPVNDAPSGADAGVPLALGATYVLAAADFGFADGDGDHLLAVTLTTLPTGGTLLLDGAAVTAGQSVSAADIDAGKLTYVADNIVGTPGFTFQVQDDGGTNGTGVDLDQSPNDFVFHVGAPPNQAPTFGADDFAIDRVSVDVNGVEGNGGSSEAVFSPDGTKLLFSSFADNLAAGDTTATADLYIKDLATGAVTLISTNSAGVQANGDSYNAVFSPDGTKVLFASVADNLVAGDTNGHFDIFVKDLATGEVTRLSTDAGGGEADDDSVVPVFSPDGSKVAFVSYADNLVAGDTNNMPDIFVKDLATGAITRVSTDSSGAEANGAGLVPVFSPDGTKILFVSDADNLVAGDTNGVPDIFVKDLVTGAVTRVSTDSSGAEADDLNISAVFSPDGTKVLFVSNADNLVADDTNGTLDVFLKDLVTGEVTRVSTAPGGWEADGPSLGAVFSPDGTKIAFFSYASNLVADDENFDIDVFVKDLLTGDVTRVSTDIGGFETHGGSAYPVFSPDGLKLAFESGADDIVPGDTAGQNDIFVANLGAVTPTYVDGVSPVQIASVVHVGDADSDNYGGGSLTIAITGGAVDGDVLLFGPGVDVDGNGDVLFNGVVVGTLTPDSLTDLTKLTIEFNASADDVAVRAIAEAAYFASLNPDPTDADRTITFTLVDGGGSSNGGSDTASFTRTVHVQPVDDLPYGTDDTASVAENATTTIDVLTNDTDPDGGPKDIVLIDGQAATVGTPITLSSGAIVTLNADGTITYDPNHAFDYLIASATSLATGALYDQATDSFSYAFDVCGCGAATVTVTINGVDGPGSRASGDSGDNVITGTPQVDMFFLEQGGHDHVTGDASNDGFYFGAAFDPQDVVDGGAGTMDQIGLQGDYSGGLHLGETSMTNVEMLVLLSGSDTRFGDTAGNQYSYDITTHDANVAAGQTLTVQGNALQAGENLTFDGSAETDGSFAMYGGLGIDHLTGGQKDDSFYFGKGGRFGPDDTVDGQGGSDQLRLQGDYSGANAVVLAPDQVKSIDLILLASAQDTRFGAAAALSYSYDLKTDDTTVAAGETMTIQGKRLLAGESLHFDGSAETDGAFKVYSGAGDDVIAGGAKADTVVAGAGDDRITGGGGADNLFGNEGHDTFVYLDASDSTVAARDHILDYEAGDAIDVSALGLNDFIGSGAFSHHAGEVRAAFVGSFWQIEGDTDGDGNADLSILVTIPSTYSWSESDFVLAPSANRAAAPMAMNRMLADDRATMPIGDIGHDAGTDGGDVGHASTLPALVHFLDQHTP